MNKPIISLCIPTNGAVNWVIQVLDSIYCQGCDDALFEVIVSDNGKKTELQDLVSKYRHSNISYYQSDAQGFMNIVSCFQLTNGLFCKLINHRAKMIQGSLKNLICLVEKYKEEQPVIYCTNGVIGDDKKEIICRDLDELVWNLHYWCTWMAGIGIWQKDVQNLDGIKFDRMFPNTTVLFEQRRNASTYLLWNEKYFEEQNGYGKGCYNLFHTFAVKFPDLLKDLLLRGRISQDTFDKVMSDLYGCLKNFYMDFVLRNPDESFDLSGIHKSITTYYTEKDYWRMIFSCYRQYYYSEKLNGMFLRLKYKIKKY